MPSIEVLTDRLLKANVEKSLPEYVADHLADGGTANTLTIALYEDTGEFYETRMVRRWIDTYGSAS